MRKILTSLVLLLLLASCATSEETYETIDISTIEKRVADGWQIVDVREMEEYKEGHISNAINVPLTSITKGDYGVLEKDQNYIIICRSGNRSETASKELAKTGFHLVNVKQGMSSWTGEIVMSD